MFNNKSLPIISVIIPYKDRHDFLLRCILSIENQNVKPFEVILINDGGIPVNLNREYSFELIHLQNDSNYGASYSRNKGAKVARGDFLFFLDSDDEWSKEHIQDLLFKSNLYPDIGFFVSSYGKKFNVNMIHENELIDDVLFIRNPSEYQFINNGSFRTSSFAIKKIDFFMVGGFDENQKKHQDWDFAFRYVCVTGRYIVSTLNVTVLIDSFAPDRMSYKSNLKSSMYFYLKHQSIMCSKSKYIFLKSVFLGFLKGLF